MADQTPKNSKTPAAKASHAATPEQVVEAALNEASAAAAALSQETQAAAAGVSGGRSLELPEFKPNGSVTEQMGLGLLDDVTLRVKVELGRTRMYVEDVLRLNANSVVELDKAAGDPVDIYVNDRHVARGEVLVLNENFCVRVSEVIQQIAEEVQS